MENRYLNSMKHLIRAENTIPLGSQTFSKSRTQYPVGISPLYMKKAKGASIWDIDDNEYVDLVNALAAITLGYGDEKTEKAVKKQLKKGVSLSLPGILEAEVAELIVDMVPSAEKVRFGKNGTDATSAAIRIARAYTGRDHVAVCGYHGWQDWYIGATTRSKGVPKEVSALTHHFEYNNIESLKVQLEKFPNKFAAVILEPMNVNWPLDDFLGKVKIEAHKAGALLIFDETITGFRFNNGGAQTLFDVIPDISTFGKGMANGFPLSAIVGTNAIMKEMENIFFSGTFGGELLSLAAAKSVLTTYLEEDVCSRLAENGAQLATSVQGAIGENKLEEVVKLSGHPSWKFITWTSNEKYSDLQFKTYFMQEMFKRGVLILNTHNISLAHGHKAREKITLAYSETLSSMAQLIFENRLETALEVLPLEPLFKIR
jgi:glutamate-1-semialdehyde 2,1-aminomutase